MITPIALALRGNWSGGLILRGGVFLLSLGLLASPAAAQKTCRKGRLYGREP